MSTIKGDVMSFKLIFPIYKKNKILSSRTVKYDIDEISSILRKMIIIIIIWEGLILLGYRLNIKSTNSLI